MAAKGLGTAAAAAGRAGQARERLAEAVAAARAAGLPGVLAACLNEQGRLLLAADPAAARSLFQQVLAAAGTIPARAVAAALLGACHADLADGAAGPARSLAEEAAVLARRVGDRLAAARALHAHGLAVRLAGDDAAAWGLQREALAIRVELGAAPGIVESLEALAGVCAGQGRGREAGELFGAADKLRADLGMVPGPDASRARARDVALAESAGPAEFERGWARGQRAEEIVTETLSREGRRATATGWGALTRAEIEVARLAAEGLTNREIGARLFVSPRTVQTHLSHVFGKLEVASRRELTREMRTRTRSLGPAEVPLRRMLGLPHETPAAPAVPGGAWRPAVSWSSP
jgi:DNA-binding CsgD family transcriptional regulator